MSLELLLVLVRHGQTEANAANIIQGWCDFPLTELGVSDAEKAGRAFGRAGVGFNFVCSSDLKRAHDTASLIAKNSGGVISSEIMQMQEVRERSFGVLERMPRGTPVEEGMRIVAEREGIPVDQVVNHGESEQQVQARAEQFLRKLLSKGLKNGSKILCVSHGAYIKLFVSQQCNIPLQEVDRIMNCASTGIRVVSQSDGSYKCIPVRVNDHDYLYVPEEGEENFVDFEGQEDGKAAAAGLEWLKEYNI